jgi:hypothetical protein
MARLRAACTSGHQGGQRMPVKQVVKNFRPIFRKQGGTVHPSIYLSRLQGKLVAHGRGRAVCSTSGKLQY